jgi:NAD dependent epimerase/dehydratase family enzyme
VLVAAHGRVGAVVNRAFTAAGHDVVPLSRRQASSVAGVVDGSDVVINLAREADSARGIAAAVAVATHPPRVWIDHAGPVVGEFPRTRVVEVDSAIVMTADPGGIFASLLWLTRLGLGGPVAGGRQWMSWIHESDYLHALEFLVEHEELQGLVTVAVPNPLEHREFMRVLRRALGVPFGLPAAGWIAETGATMLGVGPFRDGVAVLADRRVHPDRLLAAGFEFRYPTWPAAAAELIARMRVR